MTAKMLYFSMMDVSERPLTKMTVKLQRDRQSGDVIFCFCKEKRSLWDSLLHPQRLGQLCFSTKDSDLKRRLKAKSWTENSKRVCDESELQMDMKDTHRHKRKKKSVPWFFSLVSRVAGDIKFIVLSRTRTMQLSVNESSEDHTGLMTVWFL